MSKIIRSPKIYLTGYQVVNKENLDEFLKDHGVPQWTTDAPSGAEVICETGGRLCYMSFEKPRPGGNSAYLGHMKEVGHGSVLEHAVFTIIVTNVSRSLTHELVRHRAGFGYSQLSQRYVDESVAEYVVPDVIGNDPELFDFWKTVIQDCHKAYVHLSNRLNEKLLPKYENCKECGGTGAPMLGEDVGVCPKCEGKKRFLVSGVEDTTLRRKGARQAARSVLPNATETKIQVTANARAWRTMLDQRATEGAEPEIRKLAVMVWERLVKHSPNLFNDYKPKRLKDGSLVLETPFRKV